MHAQQLEHPAAPVNASERGTIIVGVDGSSASRRALRLAAEQAAQTGQTIRAVLVRYYPVDPADEQAWLQTGESLLRETVLTTVPAGITPYVEQEVLRGDPARALLHAAIGADVLVMGNVGLRGFPGELIGPVLQQVIASAPCPVLVVRDTPATTRES
jgi:nucleotide-binding universal stress UspA family protein